MVAGRDRRRRVFFILRRSPGIPAIEERHVDSPLHLEPPETSLNLAGTGSTICVPRSPADRACFYDL